MTMPPATQPYSTAAPEDAKTNTLAVVSLITSILPLYLVGIITGHIALSQIKRTGAKGRGLALAGVILGYVGFVMVFVVGVVSAVAIPVFLNQQYGARDSAVQSDIVNLKIAVVSELVANPEGAFPTIADLSGVFAAYPDTQLTLAGDAMGFCIEGYSLSNGASATHYATSDISSTVEGTCDGGVLVPAS